MSLLDQIKADQLQARRNKDSVATAVLTTLIGELQTKAINAQKELEDTEVVATVKKFVNSIVETINIQKFISEVNDAELHILNGYLPTQLGLETLEKEIISIINGIEGASIKSLGIIVKELKAKFEGQFDGKIATDLIRKQFQ